MTSIGSGYDLSAGTYSPDGRVFQIEYATKCAQNTYSCFAAVFKDGTLLAIEKSKIPALMSNRTNRHIYIVDDLFCLTGCGFIPDIRSLLNRARQEASNYMNTFNTKISLKFLVERLSLFIHAHTLYSAYRPFGCIIFIASGSEVWRIDPSGDIEKCFSSAIGRGQQIALSELEKFYSRNYTIDTSKRNEFLEIVKKAKPEGSKDVSIELCVIKSDSIEFINH